MGAISSPAQRTSRMIQWTTLHLSKRQFSNIVYWLKRRWKHTIRVIRTILTQIKRPMHDVTYDRKVKYQTREGGAKFEPEPANARHFFTK